MFLTLRCYRFKSCIFWDLYLASAYFKMDWIMKAQAHFFTGKGQQTQSICITDTKAQATIKPVSKIISIFSLATICSAICILFHVRKKKKNGVKHRFTYTYVSEHFYTPLLYFLRVLDDSIHLLKCQQMENYLSSSSS